MPTDEKREIRRAVWTVVSVNVWERYAFYTMLTLLPLFLTAPKASGGLAWPLADALLFVGAYNGIVWSSPFPGGIVADRWLGPARALVIGALMLFLGHLVLALPYALPHLADLTTGLDISGLLIAAPVPDGRFLGDDVLGSAFKGLGGSPEGERWAQSTHVAVTVSLYVAVALIAVGNGLFKPTVTLILGQMSFASDGEREAAYSQLYMGRNIGSLLAGLVAGGLGAALGWHIAFTTAAVGMAVALGVLVRRWHIFQPMFATAGVDAAAGEEDRVRLPIGLLVAFAGLLLTIIAYGLIYDQLSSLGLLFIENGVSRDVLGFAIPSTWLITLNPLFIILLTPFFAAAFGNPDSWLARLNAAERFAVAFGAMVPAFLLFMLVAADARAGALGMPLLVLAILLLTIGELCIAPVGEASIAKLAPAGWRTIAMGTWFGAIGLGGWLSGIAGSKVIGAGYVAAFAVISLASMIVAMVALLTGRLWRVRHARAPA